MVVQLFGHVLAIIIVYLLYYDSNILRFEIF